MLLCKKPRIYDVDAIGLLIVVAVGALGWLGLIKPLDGKIAEYRTQQEQARAEQSQAEEQLHLAQDKAQRQHQLVLRVQHVRDVLRQNQGIDDVIGRISVLADDYGVGLAEIRAQLPEEITHGRRAQLDIELLGMFGPCMQYLHCLTESMPFVRMSTMSVQTPSPGRGDCEISLALQIYAL